MQYIVEIDDDSRDAFEKEADNVMKVVVRNSEKEDISYETSIEIYLSQNALLGLGTEFIRLAHTFHTGKHVHLEPCDKKSQVQRLGVFLAPGSAKTAFICDDVPCIDDLL